jgi:hypothetical protein
MARKRRLYVAGVATALALGVASYGIAGGWDDGPPKVPHSKRFHAELNGFQETPSVSTTGFGEFNAKLVNDTTLHYVFTYEDLEGGNSLFAHVHFGTRFFAGGVSFFLCGGSTKPTPCPNGSGTVEGDIVAADVIGPNGQGIEPGSFAEILRAMRAGDAYANIHTTRWPAGEIRGQINDRDQKELD